MTVSLAVISFLVFLNAINHPFVHDDIVFIVQNPQIARLDHFSDIFLHPHNVFSGNGINSYYRPILEFFYRLEYQFFGFNAAGFHLFNILIHIGNGILLFFLLSRLQFSQWFAYGISLLFLIHPIQTEAVACVAGISNLLSTLFVLWTLYAYVRENYLLAVLGFVLALLTKEQVVIVPFLLILLDWYRKKNRYGLWFGFILITAGFLFLRAHMTGSHMTQDILQSPAELRLRLLAIPRTLMMYMRLLVFPYDLHYYRNTDILAPNGAGFIGLTALMVLLAGFVRRVPEHARSIAFGSIWFMICLLPVLNVIPLVNEYSLILTSEHFLYLPMAGAMIIIAVVLKKWMSPSGLAVSGIAAALILGSLSVYQNNFWRGEVPLFERMARFEPNFARGQILLAKAYHAEGQEDKALFHYNRALTIMKGYRQKSVNPQSNQFYDGFIKDINFDIAQSLQAKGLINDAFSFYKEALRIDPHDGIILEHMALAYMQAGRFDEAVETFNKALLLNPKNVSLLNNMAICYLEQGDKIQAEQFFKMALGFDPAYKPARDNLNLLIRNN